MTPRFAFRVWCAAGFVLDSFESDLLPEIVLEYLRGLDDIGRATWTGRLLASLLYIKDCCASGVIPTPRCTGEELVLQLVLATVEDDLQADEGGVFSSDDDYLALVNTQQRTLADDLRLARSGWFEDDDVMLLFEEEFRDGIDAAMATTLGTAFLDPHRWFVPFN
jgi:hypothetical protein